jgi:hypothetical protein
MALRSDRFFKMVSANTTDTQDYVIPNGVTTSISVCYGESGSSPDTAICVIWDPAGVNKLLYTTHGAGHDKLVNETVTGDGTKKVTIELVNNTNSSVTLGAGWTE